jgi:hypothetical protein
VCSVKVDVVGVDPLAAVENLEGDDVAEFFLFFFWKGLHCLLAV